MGFLALGLVAFCVVMGIIAFATESPAVRVFAVGMVVLSVGVFLALFVALKIVRSG